MGAAQEVAILSEPVTCEGLRTVFAAESIARIRCCFLMRISSSSSIAICPSGTVAPSLRPGQLRETKTGNSISKSSASWRCVLRGKRVVLTGWLAGLEAWMVLSPTGRLQSVLQLTEGLQDRVPLSRRVASSTRIRKVVVHKVDRSGRPSLTCPRAARFKSGLDFWQPFR